MQPTTKLAQLKIHAAQGDWHAALRIAAKFPRLGEEKRAIAQAWEAMVRPDFQRQLGRDPESLIQAGIEALRSKYRI